MVEFITWLEDLRFWGIVMTIFPSLKSFKWHLSAPSLNADYSGKSKVGKGSGIVISHDFQSLRAP